MKPIMAEDERLLLTEEVAVLFRVVPKTINRWAATGRLTSVRTPGGHRRFRESDVRALLTGEINGLEAQSLHSAQAPGALANASERAPRRPVAQPHSHSEPAGSRRCASCAEVSAAPVWAAEGVPA